MDNTLVYEAGDCGSIPYRRTNFYPWVKRGRMHPCQWLVTCTSTYTSRASLSRIRLAAIPLRLGRRLRRFESFMRDQFLCLGSLMVELRCYIPLTGVRFSNKVPLLSLCNVNLVDGLVWNEEAARSNRAMETNVCWGLVKWYNSGFWFRYHRFDSYTLCQYMPARLGSQRGLIHLLAPD